MLPSASVRSFTSTRMSRSAIGEEVAPQAPGAATIAPAHFEDVAKAARRDDADLRPAAFEQGVGADRGTVNDRVQRPGAAQRIEAVQEPLRFVAAPRVYLRGAEASIRGVEQEQVGERATDVDPNDDIAIAHAGVPARAFMVASASRVPLSRSTTL
jgi:hypothetical protein